MHDLIFAFAFIAMVAAPAMVAAIGGRKEYTPDPETHPVLPVHSDKPFESRRTLPPALPKALTAKKPARKPDVTTEIRTLPIHHARGLANR
ncbi:MAG TPA: hypothetical protein VHU89_16175 [Acidobacteriaceae bacterium]|jgi:hypothetical protein|nr:hypothetical protein [Acidobacteriaceae bacterium]